MKRVLIVSPHFPPVNAPDMYRVRTSLPHFEECDWHPSVLTVAPEAQEAVIEPRLLESLPRGLSVTRTGAIPLSWTRPLGVGNVALRSFAHLYHAGARLIRANAIDLVYFSTTMFAAMPLGRLWKWRFGVPYVLDLQDPWLSDYDDPDHRLPKHRQARMMHGRLEPFTMRGVDGLIAVSDAYITTLRARYPWITAEMCRTVPFGGCEEDFGIAARGDWTNPFFDPHDGCVHGVYAGAAGDAMRPASRIFARALLRATSIAPAGRPVRVSFVGTDYAPEGRQRKTVEPEAIAEGAGAMIRESPARIPYFDALRLTMESDFLILLGSADADYTPSKLFQYLLARRPIVAVLHERSPILPLVQRTRAAIVTTFAGPDDVEAAAARLVDPLAALLARVPYEPDTDWSVLAPFSARELTRQQCGLFDAVVATGHAAERVGARAI